MLNLLDKGYKIRDDGTLKTQMQLIFTDHLEICLNLPQSAS